MTTQEIMKELNGILEERELLPYEVVNYGRGKRRIVAAFRQRWMAESFIEVDNGKHHFVLEARG